MTKLSAGTCTIALATALCWATVATAQAGAQPPAVPADAPTATTAAAPVDDSGVADIVVTAQRRAESLQKTALTIQVIQPRALAASGVTNPNQLTSLVPSLQVGNSGPAPSVYLRGVGSYSSTAAQSPAIPFYTDGVYVARSQSVTSEFYDVDRLEVLKGPQGTLYGRNASGGAINILTRKPVLGEINGHAELEIGDYGNQTGEAAINLPIGDKIAIRASAQIVDKGGYSSVKQGDDVHQSGRVKLLWEPNSEMSLLLNGSYGHIGGRGPASVALNKDIPGWYPWLDAADPRAAAYQTAHAGAPIPGFSAVNDPSQARQDLRFYNLSAEFNWDLGPVTLTILPAYRHSKMQYAALFSFLYENGYGLGTEPARPEVSKATSVEARLSGNGDKLKWVAGLYYFNEDQFQQYTINQGLPFHIGVDAGFGTKSYAAFGQATFAITDEIRLIGGMRYTSDKRSIIDGVSYVISPVLFLGPPPASAVGCAFPVPTATQCVVDAYNGSKTFHNFSWKGGIEADVLDNSLFYATASRGFKAGGWNTQSVVGKPGQALLFSPETLTSYEAGLKNQFLDNKLQLNVTGFYWDYKNHQEPRVGATNSGTFNLVYYNAGSSTIYGGTVDVIARPWAGGTLNGSVEFAHSKYKNFVFTTPSATFNPTTTACIGSASSTPGFTSVDCSGFDTLKTPKWSGSIGYTHEILVGDGKIDATATMTFASSRYLSIDFTPIERAKAYQSVDASLTYRAPSDRWSLTGFVRNVNNARIYTQALENSLSSIVTANINAPRSYGGRVAFNF